MPRPKILCNTSCHEGCYFVAIGLTPLCSKLSCVQENHDKAVQSCSSRPNWGRSDDSGR